CSAIYKAEESFMFFTLCRLWRCSIGEEGCAALISALRSNPSHLTELNLSFNKPGDSGVKLLSALLEDPHCKLEKLHSCTGCAGSLWSSWNTCSLRPSRKPRRSIVLEGPRMAWWWSTPRWLMAAHIVTFPHRWPGTFTIARWPIMFLPLLLLLVWSG
uniref:NACHT LRR and PYD domain-containing protein n=1 Tax=Sinocyclocheilus rhinocerous TaxID=307959 RepID=A0A673G1T1_9TELE